MAAYQTVNPNDKNDEVRKLKELLAQNGYSGFKMGDKFGAKAQKALKQFQTTNNLESTGIADEGTWQALLAKFNGTTPSGNTYNSFEGSANAADLAAYEGAKPGAFQSGYQDQIQGLLDSVLNREKFNYDMNADPLYQQYKDQYVQQGRNAMMDTMGNAAALTGGYGNSYASTAGNQAFQSHLQGLNDRALDLYGMAYGQYQDEGGTMRDNLAALMQMDATDYGRYRDTYGDWETERDYAYGKTQDDQSQSNWQAEYELALKQLKKKGSSGGGGGGGSGGGGGGSSSSGNGSTSTGHSDSALRSIAQNIYRSLSSSNTRDPYAMVDNMSGYTAAEKSKIKAYLRALVGG